MRPHDRRSGRSRSPYCTDVLAPHGARNSLLNRLAVTESRSRREVGLFEIDADGAPSPLPARVARVVSDRVLAVQFIDQAVEDSLQLHSAGQQKESLFGRDVAPAALLRDLFQGLRGGLSFRRTARALFGVEQINGVDRDARQESLLFDLAQGRLAGAVRAVGDQDERAAAFGAQYRKSTRLNSSHGSSSYAVFCLKKKT